MVLDYKDMLEAAMAEGTPAETTDLYGNQLMPIDMQNPTQARPGQNLIQQQQPFMRRKSRTKGVLEAARLPHRNPYDNLTPEQPAPQNVYSNDESSTMSQWKGVK